MNINKWLKIVVISLMSVATFAGEILTVLNSEYYTNGETLEGFVLFNQIKANGKVLKFSIIESASDKLLHSGFIKVEDDKAMFGYDLGYNLPSMEMKVEISVMDKSYNEQLLGLAKFIILNPSSETAITNFKSINQFNPKFTVASQDISLSKSRNSLLINSNDNVIVNITQAPFNHINMTSNNQVSQSDVDTWQDKAYFNGTLVQGNKATAQNILGLYDISNDRYYMSKTQSDGRFIFLLNDFNEINTYQLFPYGEKYYQLSYQRNKPLSKLQFIENDINQADITSVLEDCKKRASINQYFGITNPIRSAKFNTRKEQAFKPVKKITPANYKSFPIFHSFCKENSLPIVFQEVNNKFNASCLISAAYSKKFNTVSENPLFIINGIATRNYDAIARLKTNEIELIEIFMDFESQRKSYNVFGSDPIIKLKLKTSDNILSKHEKENFITINGFTPPSEVMNNFISRNRSSGASPIIDPKVYFGPILPNREIPLPDNKGTFDILSISRNSNNQFVVKKQTYNSI